VVIHFLEHVIKRVEVLPSDKYLISTAQWPAIWDELVDIWSWVVIVRKEPL
jgi:hypothetical protein